MITPFPSLACPLDGAPLQGDGASWRCAAGHSFDIAAQGYTHLLPVQQKRSRDPGDSKEMVAARVTTCAKWPPRPRINKHWRCSGWIFPNGR